MKSSLSRDPGHDRGAAIAAPGRPREIEEATNLHLIHPLSRALVDQLIPTPVTPNQVSIASVFMAGAGAFCYVDLTWPWGAIAGLVFFLAWHVLDGADGDLARRTGRASTSGELVDGICDHLSQALLYVALAVIVTWSLGGWAWAIALAAAVCHFVQANAYETGRKTYRRWVYGADWMRQNSDSLAQTGALRNLLGRAYLGVSNLANPGEEAIEAAMRPRLAEDGPGAVRARDLYRRLYAPLIKSSAMLGGNIRTLVAFLAVLARAPVWFFGFEIVVLNLALAGLVVWRRRCDRALLVGLGAQAASAPN